MYFGNVSGQQLAEGSRSLILTGLDIVLERATASVNSASDAPDIQRRLAVSPSDPPRPLRATAGTWAAANGMREPTVVFLAAVTTERAGDAAPRPLTAETKLALSISVI